MENGCYAKLIDLDQNKEPEIHNAVFQKMPHLEHRVILENTWMRENGSFDLCNSEITQNSRVSYPMGYLRTFNVMKKIPKKEVTYCQYGLDYMKPTDPFHNVFSWKPRPMCKNGDPCHTPAPRGSKTGLQGQKERALVPEELCLEIIKELEKNVE